MADSPSDSGETGRPGADPADLRAVMDAAVADHHQGRLAEAIAGYRAALRLKPDFPAALNNLGVALRAAGQAQAAVESFRQALALAPRYAAAHGNLGAQLLALGQVQDAVRHLIEAMGQAPDQPRYRRDLARALRGLRFGSASPAVFEALLACLGDAGIDHQILAVAALSLLELQPAVRGALALAGRNPPATLDDGVVEALLGDQLLRALWVRAILPDPRFENLSAALRSACLRWLPAEDWPAALLPGLAALACQCFATDYAYPESEDEQQAVAELVATAPGAALSSGRLTPALAVLALYRPLHALPDAAALAKWLRADDPFCALLIARQLTGPLRERDIERALPRLTEIDAGLSTAMRAHYEAHPYPRWLSTWERPARPLPAVIHELFPHTGPVDLPAGTTRILVAGCGTGRHAVNVATRYADAEVLAVDLSRNSLAYGAAQAEARGLTNIRFGQADLLCLGELQGGYHLIESAGVLHHLADPLAGARVLRGLLAPGGFLRLGLYSTAARRHIAAARAVIEAAGFAAEDAGIRAARQAILALSQDAPARGVIEELDFYSLAGCRDLLFNLHEVTYAIPEIAALIAALDVEFLGFEFFDRAPQQDYATRFPDDPAMADLTRWQQVEDAAPGTFRFMYQFWCRAR